ncbi:MAG: hypothetical protein HYU36_11635 [Planctomycetes bacterium]|nr:hypothetical protein [Planctomycetota bacterium]
MGLPVGFEELLKNLPESIRTAMPEWEARLKAANRNKKLLLKVVAELHDTVRESCSYEYSYDNYMRALSLYLAAHTSGLARDIFLDDYSHYFAWSNSPEFMKPVVERYFAGLSKLLGSGDHRLGIAVIRSVPRRCIWSLIERCDPEIQYMGALADAAVEFLEKQATHVDPRVRKAVGLVTWKFYKTDWGGDPITRIFTTLLLDRDRSVVESVIDAYKKFRKKSSLDDHNTLYRALLQASRSKSLPEAIRDEISDLLTI